jgi:hypothetical protein
MEQIKTMGGFSCPHCRNLNLCTCPTCKPFYEKNGIGDRKFAVWEDNGEILVCQYCNERFSLDESLEAEWEDYKKEKDNEVNILRAE